MNTKNWHRAVHDAEQERDNALAQLAHEQATRREWQTQYQAEHRDYLNDVEADRDRLRDGIKALITSGNSVPVSTVRAEALRALLDGEAKG